MNTDDALAHTRELVFAVWSLSEQTNGTWRARLWNRNTSLHSTGKPGFNDAFTDFGEGLTPGEAILHAAKRRYDRKTGEVVEHKELPSPGPDTNRQTRNTWEPVRSVRDAVWEEVKPLALPAPPLTDAMARLGRALDALTEALS